MDATGPVTACSCLCKVAHGSLGVCVGTATTTRWFGKPSGLAGMREVPMCQPCADAYDTHSIGPVDA